MPSDSCTFFVRRPSVAPLHQLPPLTSRAETRLDFSTVPARPSVFISGLRVWLRRARTRTRNRNTPTNATNATSRPRMCELLMQQNNRSQTTTNCAPAAIRRRDVNGSSCEQGARCAPAAARSRTAPATSPALVSAHPTGLRHAAPLADRGRDTKIRPDANARTSNARPRTTRAAPQAAIQWIRRQSAIARLVSFGSIALSAPVRMTYRARV